VTRIWRPLLVLPLAGCSDVTSVGGGVVALELRLPNPPVVEQNDTLQLHARALNAKGDSVAATIVWRTPDSTLAVEDSGRVSTDLTTGSGRVQAMTDGLVSDLVSFQIRPRSDTLALTGALFITVPATDSASAALDATVQSLSPDTVGISGTTVLYEVVETADAQDRLHFAGGGLTLRATTSSTGAPVVPVTLRKAPGTTPPAMVTVRASATRPSGQAVPGSGQVFTLNFQ
jgi:hypothetical protein